MNQHFPFFLFVVFLFANSVCFSQTTIDTAKVFAPHDDVIDSLVIQGINKRIRVLSNGSAKGKIEGKNVEFKIPISKDTYLASLYLAETDSTLIFFYEESIATHSSTHFVIFSKSDFQPIVKEDIYAFNLTEPVFKNNFMYLMTFGFVGKYDLKEKRYAWTHSDLYNHQRSTFNLIDQPKFKNGKVIFTTTGYKDVVDSLVVDDQSGKIIPKTY